MPTRQLFWGLFLLVGLASRASADPLSIVHAGRLLDGADVPVSGPRSMRFALYATGTAGSPVWRSDASAAAGTPCVVNVTGGAFSVSLGRDCGDPIDSALWTSGSLWLETVVDNVGLAPRAELGPVPVSVISLDTQSLTARLVQPGTLNATGNPVHWTQLKGVPAELADGTDATATAAVGGGLESDGAGGLSIGVASISTARLAPEAVTLSRLSGGLSAADGTVLGRVGGSLGWVGAASTVSAGLLSAADKSKLDSLSPGSYLSGISGTGPVSVGSGAVPSISIAAATTTSAGLLSAADKSKLDGLSGGPAVPSVVTRPSSPAAGLLIFNTTTRSLEYYDGSTWNTFAQSKRAHRYWRMRETSVTAGHSPNTCELKFVDAGGTVRTPVSFTSTFSTSTQPPFDGSVNYNDSGWIVSFSGSNGTLVADLGSPYSITTFGAFTAYTGGQRGANWEIAWSDDNSTFTPVGTFNYLTTSGGASEGASGFGGWYKFTWAETLN